MNHAIQRLERQLASAVKLTLFKRDLKILREDAPLMLSGRLFHKREDTITKAALSPQLF